MMLRRRMKLYAFPKVSDGAGGHTEEPVLWGSVRAEFIPLRSGERIEAMANNLEIGGRVRMRYRPDLPSRIVLDYEGQYMENIGPPRDEKDRRRYAVYDVRLVDEWTPPEEA